MDLELPDFEYAEADTSPAPTAPKLAAAPDDDAPTAVAEDTSQDDLESLGDAAEGEEEEAAGEEEPEEAAAEEPEAGEIPAGDVLSDLPDIDHAAIKGSPELAAVHRHMQAAFTRKMQSASESARRAQAVIHEHNRFVERLGTEEGQEQLLMRLATQNPALFERVFDRALEVQGDAEKRSAYLKEEEERDAAAEREAAAAREQERAEAEAVQALEDHALAECRKARLEPEEYEVADQFIATRIQENLKAGRPAITSAEITELVGKAARLLKKQATAAKAEESQARARALAQNAKRPAAPKASRSPAPSGKVPRSAPPQGEDPVNHRIDSLMGLFD